MGWGFGLRSLSIADEIQPLKSAVLLFCFDCGVLVRKKVHITSVRPYLPPYSYRPHTRQTGRFVSSQRPLALKPPSPCKRRGSSRARSSPTRQNVVHGSALWSEVAELKALLAKL